MRFLEWGLIGALLLSIALKTARADEKPLDVPVVIDEARNLVVMPLDWFKALIGAHNEQVLEIRKLKRGTGCV